MDFKEHLKKYAERELELTGFNKTPFGKTALVLLDELADLTNNNPETMKQLCRWLERFIDNMPVAPITEQDFVSAVSDEGQHVVKLERCNRYPYVYRSEDGKYWDDRAVAFKFADSAESDMMFLYGVNGSKREITLPYYPKTIIQELPRNNL